MVVVQRAGNDVSRRALAVSALALVVVLGGVGACSDDDSQAADAEDSEGPAETTETTDDGAETDDIESLTADFLEVDWDSVEPAELPDDPADAIVGGAPDTTRGRAIRESLGSTGVDLTGTGVHVLPITGTGQWLLVLDVTDESALAGSGASSSDSFVFALIDQMETHGIAQLALNYTGSDDQGPFVLTATASLEDLQAAAAEEADPAEILRIQLERET